MNDEEAARRQDSGGAAPDEPPEPLEEILSVFREAFEMDVAFVAEFVEDEQVFRALEGDAESFGWKEDEGIPLEGSFYKRVIDGRIPNVIPDARNDDRTKDLGVTREADIGSYVGFPLRRSDGRLYGTLCCVSHTPDPLLRDRDMRLVEDLAHTDTRRLENEGLL